MTTTPTGTIAPDVEQAIDDYVAGPVADVRALNRILTRMYPAIEVWAMNSALDHGLGYRAVSVSSDAGQLMAMAVTTTLMKAQATSGNQVKSWPGYLHAVARHRATAYWLSPEFTGVPHSTGQQRRARRLARVRNGLTCQLGRSPSAQEILAAHNTGVLESRSSPAAAAKSGQLASLDEARNVADKGV